MRFVCDRCKSKYSISDEKVRGKILKIRCKRCNHIIEVRDPAAAKSAVPPPSPLGAALAPPPPAERRASDMPEEHTQISSPGLLDELRRTAANLALQPSAEPVLSEWYVAIDDEPTGPMTREEVRGYVAAGRVYSESLVWREGFDDWRPLREVPDLKDLLRGSRALSAVAAPPRSRATTPAPPRRQGSGLAEVIPLRRQADTTPAPPRNRESGPMGLEPVDSPEHSPPPPPAFGGGAQRGLVAAPLRGREVGRLGARPRTGSVAVPLPGSQPATPPPPPGGAAVSALSELPGSPTRPAPPPPAPMVDGSLAGLVSAPPPAFDATGGGGSAPFAIPLAEESPVPPPPPAMAGARAAPSPSMLPIVQQATAGRRRLALILLVVGAIVLGVVGAVVVVKLAGDRTVQVAEGSGNQPRSPGPLVDTPPTKGTGDPAIKGLLGSPEEPPDEAGEDPESEGPVKGAAVRPGGGPRPPAGVKGKTLTEEEERLLAEAKALGGGAGPVAGKAKSGGESGGGEVRRGDPLTQAQVRSTVGKNMSSIQRCYEREMRGAKMQRDLRVTVRIRITPSGRVRSSNVGTGTVRGTALGICIEGAVARWVFPTATGESNVEIPIVLTPRR